MNETKGLAASVSPTELWAIFERKVLKAQADYGDTEGILDPVACMDVDEIAEGCQVVTFDMENSGCGDDKDDSHEVWHYLELIGPRQFGDLSVIGCWGAGDWEIAWGSVYFVVYLDADGETLRAYVPKEGNIWNHGTMMAFGNHDSDQEFLTNWLEENEPGMSVKPSAVPAQARAMASRDKIIRDILVHIQVHS